MNLGGTIQRITRVRDWVSLLEFVSGEEGMTKVSPGQRGLLWAPPLAWHSVMYWEYCCGLPASHPSPGSDLFPQPYVPTFVLTKGEGEKR